MPAIGRDRSVGKPLDPHGTLYEGRLGGHTGDFEALNIRNPKPGFAYANFRFLDPKTGKLDPKRVMHAKGLGYDFPQNGESLGDARTLSEGTNLELRDDITFMDVVLMACPVERAVERANEKAAKNAQLMQQPTDTLLANQEFSEFAANKPLRFRLPGHGFRRAQNAEEAGA